MKITFMGAGSTVFVRNVIGDCLRTPALQEAEYALYDVSPQRLEDSRVILSRMNEQANQGRARIVPYLGEENRKEALRGADFVINAIQVGGYDPCTITDFEVPKKYGLRQTIADTLGVGGVMRGLRTIPVMAAFARDMEEVCPDALLLNYTNPMSILSGYMQRYTGVNTVGLCHSVQTCSRELLKALDMEDKVEGRRDEIAGINHMGWLLRIEDKEGNDLYPEIRRRALHKNDSEIHKDMVRFEYIRHFGYYCTESSEHNAEYNPYFIKSRYPELIERFNIPLDEYPRRCIRQINAWEEERAHIMDMDYSGHQRSREYASGIMEGITLDQPYRFGGNVPNTGLITNLPKEACVEVTCVADGMGVRPMHVGDLPVQLAALNMTNINVHLMTIQAAVTQKKEDVYRAVMLDPHTAAELSLDDIVAMVDELIERHGKYMSMYK